MNVRAETGARRAHVGVTWTSIGSGGKSVTGRVAATPHQGQCVVHTPLSQATVIDCIAQLLPSSAVVACAAQPHAAQVASHVASAAVKASRCAWLIPTATWVPQQFTWWKPIEQVSAVVHFLSNMGKVVPPPQVPPDCGRGQMLLPHVPPVRHMLPLATQLLLSGSQQPLPQSAPSQHG